MGVYGLWRLLNATGEQVPLETLEGKILAIDISIWIHQVLQGYQDRFGNPKPNAHLIGLFHRICKLLYYKIKPVFVFDGGVPMLKKNTTALRRKQKSMAKNKAQQMRTELINNLIKHSTVKTALNIEMQNNTNESSEVIISLQNKQTVDDMFKLPNMPSTSKAESSSNDVYDSDSSDELSPRKQTKWIGNIHNVDVTSAEFKDLPADVRYEILTDLKETRKQSSWGRLHEMPEESNEFSGFQMKRLLKRRLVQQSLENAEKEMGGKTLTLEELDKLLKEQGIPTDIQNYTHRIAADNTTRLIYISDKNAYFKNKNNVNSNNESTQNNEHKIDEVIAGPSKSTSIRDDINEYELNDNWDSDIEITATNNFKFISEMNNDTESETESRESRTLSKKYLKQNVMNPALTYMLEYSGLTEKQILTLLENNGEMCKNVKNASRISEQTDSHKIDNCDNKNNFLNAQHLNPKSENDKKYTKFDCTNVVESIDESKILSETNTETNINLSPIKIANISNKAQFESETAIIINSTDSDSDSDDFIEIKDIPASKENTIINNYVSQQSIQITFKSDEKVEDDMFADIFETSNNKLNLDKETSKNKITFEKEVIESTKNQIKDNQLFNAKKFDNINKQSDIDIDLNILNTNVQLKENQIEDKINIEKVTNVSKNNIENTNIKDDININTLSNPIEKISPIPMNENELLSLQAQLEDKQTELIANIGKLERQGIDISDQIRIEAQELLQLFGIPYLVAPMEAEAQCAYLEQIHLTDGTITDDSDIWLFGGQCVYKNFFDNNKKVLEFRACNIQRYFKLTRNEMIRLALLVGSDYTTGLTGIGPVTALEILAAFPSEGDNLLQGLVNFCSWIENGKATGPGKTSLRTKLQNLEIQKGFPNQAVVQAYLSPMVDESKETFSWGKPNIILLGDYAKQKFGWDKDKYNKIITPVLNRLKEKQIQNKIDAYFKLQTIPKSIEINLSQRVQKAVEKLNNDNIKDFKRIENLQSLKKQKSSNENQKKRKELKNEQTLTGSAKPKIFSVPSFNEKNVDEYIPQREHDKANALKNKLHAIEVLRKSKQGLYKTKKIKRCVRKIKKEAELSESDSSSS
ncbi:DNA excision repair protein ERCC-5 homolog [Apis laboriosa]|uniref:DNA excision repair protein ERCC-5 homolog n=1 Tax=Apis laboriosa TaxID=183418 RepID=UPI001CC59D8E|nr:DNA excision repair protein ERCC-5 homolog [Apis laboriosa]XP_043793029.1 DNA excision repair protein ERCC-5 homolog [Apis laboriosa]